MDFNIKYNPQKKRGNKVLLFLPHPIYNKVVNFLYPYNNNPLLFYLHLLASHVNDRIQPQNSTPSHPSYLPQISLATNCTSVTHVRPQVYFQVGVKVHPRQKPLAPPSRWGPHSVETENGSEGS